MIPFPKLFVLEPKGWVEIACGNGPYLYSTAGLVTKDQIVAIETTSEWMLHIVMTALTTYGYKKLVVMLLPYNPAEEVARHEARQAEQPLREQRYGLTPEAK